MERKVASSQWAENLRLSENFHLVRKLLYKNIKFEAQLPLCTNLEAILKL